MNGMEDLPDLYLLEQADSKTVLRPFGSRKPISETNLEKDIEEWVMASMLRGIPVLGELALFARQPSYRASKARRPDLLALDAEKNVVVIEFKRDHADEDILFQTLNYAAWISEQSYETLDRFAARFLVELPAPQPTSLKEAYYKAFPASTGDEAEEAEAALPSDQEFLAGFNSRPRIVIVAAEIAEEIQRILRFLTSHGIRCEAHEFQYFESPKGDRLIHRRAVARMKTATPKPDGGPAYATLDDLNSYVLEPIVRPWIDALPEWVGDEFESGEASLSVPGNGNLRIRLFGKTVASGYFAKRWLFVWWQDRFPDDESWFKERLSRPEQVKVDQTDTLRFHVATAADLDVLKAALKDAEARNSTA
jgi:hypothetical protein